MFDLLRFALAILPLAAYTNVLGLLRLRSSPTVISGAMDILLLGLAVIGIVSIGPIELFFPRAAYSLLGGWVWIVLIALYIFILMLVALNSVPTLIVYGLHARALKQLMCDLLQEHQIKADWLGDLLELPELGVRASIEPAGRGCISQIHAAGRTQNLTGWFTLERLLVDRISKSKSSQRREAVFWLLTSFALFAVAAIFMGNDLPRLQQAVANIFESS